MVKKALPIAAVVMTMAAAYFAVMNAQKKEMLKQLKGAGANPVSTFTPAQKKYWDSL